jgi:hypothetical protein
MSANTSPSKKESFTDKNTKSLHNNYSNRAKLNYEENKVKPRLKITVTKHLGVPCPGFYEDILKKALIICKDPSHNQDVFAEDDTVTDKIERFLKSNEKEPFGNNNNNLDLGYNNTVPDFYLESQSINSNIAEITGTKKSNDPLISKCCNQVKEFAKLLNVIEPYHLRIHNLILKLLDYEDGEPISQIYRAYIAICPQSYR